MSIIFADYDGTYDTHENVRKEAVAIVTGNSWENKDDVFDFNVPTIPVFFNPVSEKENTQAKIILHKAEIINRCKATVFWEDIPAEAVQLRLLCPGCIVKLVPKKKS